MLIPDKAILYAGDPMCSWCYGFSPALEQAMHEYEVPFIPVMGGLRPGANSEAMDDRLSRFLEHHWKQVEKLTGRPFDYSILSRRDFRYDTEPSCRAVVAVREMRTDLAFPFYFALQSAFYARAENPTDEQTFIRIAQELGIDADAFVQAYHSEENAYETKQDFQLCHALQITGFPALMYIENRVAWPIAKGYRDLDDLRAAIDHTLKAAAENAAEKREANTVKNTGVAGESCATDGSGC